MAKKNEQEKLECHLCGTMLEPGEEYCSNCGEEVNSNGNGGNGNGDDDDKDKEQPPFKGW